LNHLHDLLQSSKRHISACAAAIDVILATYKEYLCRLEGRECRLKVVVCFSPTQQIVARVSSIA
jgi:hypothetical protein